MKKYRKSKMFIHLLVVMISCFVLLKCSSKSNSKIIVLGVYTNDKNKNPKNDTIAIFKNQIQVDSILRILISSKPKKIKSLEYNTWINLLIYRNDNVSKKITLKFNYEAGNYFINENKTYDGDRLIKFVKNNYIIKQ